MNLVRALKNTKSRKNPVKQFFCLLLKKVLNSYKVISLSSEDALYLYLAQRGYTRAQATLRS